MTEPEKWAYNEDLIVAEFLDYLRANVYDNHYGNIDAEVQPIDVLFCRGHGESFCIGNAVKYLLRYGKKDGQNRDDLLKAMHYIVWLLADPQTFRRAVEDGRS